MSDPDLTKLKNTMPDYFGIENVETPALGLEQKAVASAYLLDMTGAKTGHVDGNCRWKGFEKTIECIQFDHVALSPRDAASGLPTGKRLHHPVRVIGRYTSAMPLMFNMLANNENITKFKLSCLRPPDIESAKTAPTGQGMVTFYTIELVNANIQRLDHLSSELDGTLFFRAAFVYEKITLTWLNGGITASDDWNSPTV